ncbi:MAG: glycosyltransferase [Gammaproteobacteria bacterium]|nr:glycosyltransferase [Gammaproteobacteria bacterium]MBU2236373.1 glycosyltransferase [Gammaproteobacteria bacterium]MBU2318005.1 glycosyltransferase [Gammaproteobacteria bacterium]MBU2412137.1 glycosyltransferase [Gammaproteobacteria bacterium]
MKKKYSEDKVCAIVVTFNRKMLLKECLKGVMAQTHGISCILIVDNASTDDTEQLLLNEGYIRETPSKEGKEPFVTDFKKNNSLGQSVDILYVRMPINTGGAGGFYEGQKRAYDLGYTWLWLMDDDGYPEDVCVEKLLDKSDETSLLVLNPIVINVAEKSQLSFGLSKSIQTVDDAKRNKDEYGLIRNLANPFNGTFLHRNIIERNGLIKKEMFIWGDESEYFKRIASSGEGFATVVDANFFHPVTKTVYKTKFGFLRIPTKPEKLEMNFYRNQGYLNRKYGSVLSHRVLFKVILFYFLEGDFKKVNKVFKYYLDGFYNRYNLPCMD